MGTVSPAFKQLLVIESGLLFEANKMKNLLLLLAVATYVSAAVVPNPPRANHELSSVYRRNYDKREAAFGGTSTSSAVKFEWIQQQGGLQELATSSVTSSVASSEPRIRVDSSCTSCGRTEDDLILDWLFRQSAAQENDPRWRVEDDSLAGCDPRFPC